MRTASRTPHATRTSRTSHRAATGRAVRGGRRPVLTPVQASVCRPAPTAGTHLTRRGRLLAVLLLVGLLFSAFSLGRAGTEAATSPEPAAAVVQTTVQPGESLWTVAQRIAPQSDPRDVVEQLRRLNDLSGSGLQSGQQLLLPA